MDKVINLEEIKARKKKEEEQQFFYAVGFVHGRFPEVDFNSVWGTVHKAFYEAEMSVEQIKEFTFTWDEWSNYMATIEICAEYTEEQRNK